MKILTVAVFGALVGLTIALYQNHGLEVGFVMGFFAIMPVIIYLWGREVWFSCDVKRSLSFIVYMEPHEDLRALHGFDLKEELSKVLAEEIRQELLDSGGGMTREEICRKE